MCGCLILVFIFLAIISSIYETLGTPAFVTLIFIIIITTIIVWIKGNHLLQEMEKKRKQRETEEIEQHCRNGKKLLEQINIIVVQAVLEHLQILDIKYQQSIYKDDYGCLEEHDWLKEIEYFVSKVVSPILAKKITDKQNSYALLCSSYRTKFLFPQQFDWVQLKDYKTLIDLEFLDKQHNVITFNKAYLERSIFILDGYADLIYLLKNNVLNDKKTSKEKINIAKEILEEKDCKGISLEEMSQRMTSITNLTSNNPQYNDDNTNSEYPNSVYLVSYDIQCSKEALTQMVYSMYNALKSYINAPQEIEMTDISPYEFEKECARILNKKGFNARATKGSGDQGVDVLAEKNNIKIAIQCKQYSKPVGNKAVQEVIAGKNFYNAQYAAVVSNASFTPSARKLAAKCGVILLDVRMLDNLEEYLKIADNPQNTINSVKEKALIKNEADVKAKAEDKYATLITAIANNSNPDVIENLIKKGANVNAKTKGGYTALMIASIENSNPAVIETLIKNGADVNAETERGFTALMMAKVNNSNPAIIETLIKNGAKD